MNTKQFVRVFGRIGPIVTRVLHTMNARGTLLGVCSDPQTLESAIFTAKAYLLLILLAYGREQR